MNLDNYLIILNIYLWYFSQLNRLLLNPLTLMKPVQSLLALSNDEK